MGAPILPHTAALFNCEFTTTVNLFSRSISTYVASTLSVEGDATSLLGAATILKPGGTCQLADDIDSVDSLSLVGCPNECEPLSPHVQLVNIQGNKIGCDATGISCESAYVSSITIVNMTAFIANFSGAIDSAVLVGDKLVIDLSMAPCADPTVCGVLSGITSPDLSCRKAPGNMIQEILTPDSLLLFTTDSSFPPSWESLRYIFDAHYDWEVANRVYTSTPITRFSPAMDLSICLMDAVQNVAMIEGGYITFKTPPSFSSLSLITVARIAERAVPVRLVVRGLLAGSEPIPVIIKIVLPATDSFDINVLSEYPSILSDGSQHDVSCGSILHDIEPAVDFPSPARCFQSSLSSKRREIFMEFRGDHALPSDFALSVNAVIAATLPSPTVAEIHVYSPSKPDNLIQLGFFNLPNPPSPSSGINGSHWLESGGLRVVSDSLSPIDLRTANSTVSLIFSGSMLEKSSIKNNTIIRIIGWKNILPDRVLCSPVDNTVNLDRNANCLNIMEAHRSDNVSFSFIYVGTPIWGPYKFNFTFTHMEIPNEGFLPLQLIGELTDPHGTGEDITWSSGSLIWGSPRASPQVVQAQVLATEPLRIFVNSEGLALRIKVTFPWILLEASRITIYAPPEIVFNQTGTNMATYVLSDWAPFETTFELSVRPTGLGGSGPLPWKFSIFSSRGSVSYGPLAFAGQPVYMIERVLYSRAEIVNPKTIWVWVSTGTRSSTAGLIRAGIELIPRWMTQWLGRRTCTVSDIPDARVYSGDINLSIGLAANCSIGRSGTVLVSIVGDFLEANKTYLFQARLDDDQWTPRLGNASLDMFIRDRNSSPLEGITQVPVIGTFGQCSRVDLLTSPSLMSPGTSGNITLNLKIRRDAASISVRLIGGQFQWSNQTWVDNGFVPVNVPSPSANRSVSDLVWTTTVEVGNLSYNSTQSIVVTCIGSDGIEMGSSRAFLPATADVYDYTVSASSLISAATIQFTTSFSANFPFTTVQLGSPYFDAGSVLVYSGNSIHGQQQYRFSSNVRLVNISNSGRTIVPIELVVDNITKDGLAVPLFQRISSMSVRTMGPSQPHAWNLLNVSFVNEKICRKNCSLILQAPSGVAFDQLCEIEGLSVNYCIGKGNEVLMESNVNLGTGAGIWFSLRFVNPDTQIPTDSVWRILVGTDQAGEFRGSAFNLGTFSNVSLITSVGSLAIGGRATVPNLVDICFVPRNGSVAFLELSVPPSGFRVSEIPGAAFLRSSDADGSVFDWKVAHIDPSKVTFAVTTGLNESQSSSIRVTVSNPSVSNPEGLGVWRLTSFDSDGLLVDSISIIQPMLVESLEGLIIDFTNTSHVTVAFQTSQIVTQDDMFVFETPKYTGDSYRFECGTLDWDIGNVVNITQECSTDLISLRVAGPTKIFPAGTQLFFRTGLSLPSMTPDINTFTLSHVRDQRVIAATSFTGPTIVGLMRNVSISVVGLRRAAGSVTDIELSFMSIGACNSIELVAHEPIGFDFTWSAAMVDGYERGPFKNVFRVFKDIRDKELVIIQISNVSLPPFAGPTVFDLRSTGAQDERIVSEVHGLSGFNIPSRLAIKEFHVSPETPGGLQPLFSNQPMTFNIIFEPWDCDIRKSNDYVPSIEVVPEFLDLHVSRFTCNHLEVTGLTPFHWTERAVVTASFKEGDRLVATNDGESVSLRGQLGVPLAATIQPLSRTSPRATVKIQINITGDLPFDSLDILAPTGFTRMSGLTNVSLVSPLQLTYKLPRVTPIDNYWILTAESADGVLVGWSRLEGFEILQLMDTRIVYPPLPRRQVPMAVNFAAHFTLPYPTSLVKLIRLTLPVEFKIELNSTVHNAHIPVKTWSLSSNVVDISVNDTMLARSYAFSFLVFGPSSNPANVGMALELLDSDGDVVDACYAIRTQSVQFGIPFAPSRPQTLFEKDDQSSVVGQGSNISTQESSEILVAQLSSFREVFPFRLFARIKVPSINLIRVSFPDKVTVNKAWNRKDPILHGFVASQPILDHVDSVEVNEGSIDIYMNSSWVDYLIPEMGTVFISIPVTLPQSESLPAFNYFTVSLIDRSNATLVDYVFQGHALQNAAGDPEISLLLSSNVTSDSGRKSNALAVLSSLLFFSLV